MEELTGRGKRAPRRQYAQLEIEGRSYQKKEDKQEPCKVKKENRKPLIVELNSQSNISKLILWNNHLGRRKKS